VFRDPIVELKGRDALKAYYPDMYENVTSIRFDFSGGIEKDEGGLRMRKRPCAGIDRPLHEEAAQ
jgi:hypothetical protein